MVFSLLDDDDLVEGVVLLLLEGGAVLFLGNNLQVTSVSIIRGKVLFT